MPYRIKHLLQVLLLVIPSIVLLYGSLWVTVSLWYPFGLPDFEFALHATLFTFVFALWLCVFFATGLFDSWRHHHIRDFVGAFLLASAINIVLAIIVFYIQPELVVTPRRFLVVQFVFSHATLFGWLFFMRLWMRGRVVTPVYFFGMEGRWIELTTTKEPAVNHSLDLVSVIDTQQPIKKSIKACDFGRCWIVVRDGFVFTDEQREDLESCHRAGAMIIPFSLFYEDYLRRIDLDSLSDLWFLSRQPSHMFRALKRVLDVCSGLLIGVVFLVTLPFVALAIKLSSSGPIFFLQERHSTYGRPFKIVKYRTMKTGTATDTWTQKKDVRITNVGSFLRKTRLDELPQFINLLRGEMSLVGPRPEQSHLSRALSKNIPFYHRRHEVVPGITGWAQLYVYASDEEGSRKKLMYDLYYLKHQSFLFDLEILVKTVFHLIKVSGR